MTTTKTRDIFLSPDERYQVWTVKAAERPELLLLLSTSFDDPPPQYDDDEKDDDDDKVAQNLLPLMDGCDIPAWRKEQLIPLKAEHEATAVLKTVGPGCTLLRRESQIPSISTAVVVSNTDHNCHLSSSSPFSNNENDGSTEPAVCNNRKCQWERIRQELLQSPPVDTLPERIHYSQLCSSSSSSSSSRKDDHDNNNNNNNNNNNKFCLLLHPSFERENRPVILDGCMDNWAAMKTCRFDRLVERFGHLEWRFSDTHAETMSLYTYSKYITTLEGLTDDAPLAVYDSQFDRDERCVILDEYTVPKCFDTDLFVYCSGKEKRPPFRWILIGPSRSGTGLHVDPVGTHAWVSLVVSLCCGRPLWKRIFIVSKCPPNITHTHTHTRLTLAFPSIAARCQTLGSLST